MDQLSKKKVQIWGGMMKKKKKSQTPEKSMKEKKKALGEKSTALII